MRSAPTTLTRLRWDIPDVGIVIVRAATFNNCVAIDATWPPSRRPADVHHAWRWVDIWSSLKDCFVIMDSECPVAIWGSSVSRPLQLAGTTYYRLDYLEISPAHRGKILGAFSTAVIAFRASELGATGIVLTAFHVPGLVEFYEKMGAVRGAPRGWSHPKELVPLTFELSALQRLKEFSDAFLEEK